MINAEVTTDQKVTLKVAPKSPSKKPAKIDGIPAWVLVSGPGVLTPATDGLSAELASPDDLNPDPTENVGVVTVTADVDLGEGVENLTDTATIQFISPKADSLDLTADEPVDK